MKKCQVPVGALNEMQTASKYTITATIKSRINEFSRTLTFLTIPLISTSIPDTHIDRSNINIPKNVILADPEFHKPAGIDMILSTGSTLASLSIGQYNLTTPNSPDLILQKTQFGWVIGGHIVTGIHKAAHQINYIDIDAKLTKFWEIEEGNDIKYFTIEEQTCENHFQQHVTRDPTGRYIVALPFNEKIHNLGESREQALNRFFALERKFKKNPKLKEQYTAVIEEYLSMGHASPINPTNDDNLGFYLPHHAVFKESSQTTKVRVVFDGSAKSSSKLSLNETLRVGPTIQDDLFDLLIRFRMHVYVLCADIEKMYRQFLIKPEDRKYQRIFWRNRDGKLIVLELNTITFGISSAPFLAIRCIHQLAKDERARYPLAADTLEHDLYVDNLVTGADTLEELHLVKDQIENMLKLGGMTMRQWASNENSILHGLPQNSLSLPLQDDGTVNTLGLAWNPLIDSIEYIVKPPNNQRITKRSILSDIATIFDPIGLLGPVIITAKLTMQKLWELKLDWDETLPASIYTEWKTYINQLHILNNISFKRGTTLKDASNEIHGFCDASERAYGACIYIRSSNAEGQTETHLLCAKTRVAPLKTISVARLELCGALLLAKLYDKVIKTLRYPIKNATFWCDSTITLNWIAKPPNTLKTFVANRVSEIQVKTDIQSWKHVRTHDNPADILSRGQTSAEFIHNQAWKHGPRWLKQKKTEWPCEIIETDIELPEMKKITCFLTNKEDNIHPLNRVSSFNKLKRAYAYCHRFKPKSSRGPLSTEELINAENTIIKLVQATAFTKDIQDLKTKGQLQRSSKILSLHPFLDKCGILRVGGRLQNSSLNFSQKHPILLPKHYVTELLIRKIHIENYHTGIQATLYAARQSYWPIDGRQLTRKVIRACVTCFRFRPPSVDYIMGNLPVTRVTESRPFCNTGVDFCGPFFIKEKRHRNRTKLKVYVAVFICLATKAVHLELVSELTTTGFLAALRRFISRRGLCETISSDNGSNFKGANTDLQEVYQILTEEENNGTLTQYLANKGITWKFIPPLSPHFGGLWEAAVKSFKHHMKRVVGDLLFTFEDLNTFVIEVEAILNSRPLTLLSSDPNDLTALSPAHFLIGNTLNSLPEVNYRSVTSNKLCHWQHIQKLKRDFWIRWHQEYINGLNIRQKWSTGHHKIKIDSIVVIKDVNLPPLQWSLGIIIEVHPGADGIIRAVTVRTTKGTYRRNVKHLAPLPFDESEDGQQTKKGS